MHFVRTAAISEHESVDIYEVDGKYYAVREYGDNQVVTGLDADQPDSGTWVAGASDAGIKYVARGRTRSATNAAIARQRARHEDRW